MDKNEQLNIVAAILTAGHLINTKDWEENIDDAVMTFGKYREKLKDQI